MPDLQAFLALIFALIAISLRSWASHEPVGAKPSPAARAPVLPPELLLR
jgi:hypothetical protein